MTDSEVIVIEPEMRLGIIPARTPHDLIVQATEIAKELANIIKTKKLSRIIQGKEYVYVEGWSTMGAMLGVLPREVSELTRRIEDGGYEATVELIRITDGAVVGRASALVGMDEKDSKGKMTWGSRAEYARRSMAVTRATGKAYRLGFSWIMALAGYAPTPAEEMGAEDGQNSMDTSQDSTPPIMSLEFAMNETNRNGVKYSDLDNDTLSNMTRELDKKLKGNGLSQTERDEKKRKLAAAKTILEARAKSNVGEKAG